MQRNDWLDLRSTQSLWFVMLFIAMLLKPAAQEWKDRDEEAVVMVMTAMVLVFGGNSWSLKPLIPNRDASQSSRGEQCLNPESM